MRSFLLKLQRTLFSRSRGEYGLPYLVFDDFSSTLTAQKGGSKVKW